MTMKYGELVASVQAKIDSDTEFQNTLAGLSDDDKVQAVAVKQEELLDAEISALEAKATKAEEIATNQKIRAEKAEAEAKKPKETETPKNESLTATDVVALRDVHEEDVGYLLGEAKLRNKSISELKADPYIKIILQTKAEERKTAAAINTGSSRKSTSVSKPSDLAKKAINYLETGGVSPEERQEAARAVIDEVFGKK